MPMQWLVTVAMGAWAVLTWAHEQKDEREKVRERMAALYVQPFLSACEDLQSRIYKIIETRGLSALRERYPDGTYAEETIYLLCRYFGWLAAVNRYGPYTSDPVVIRLATAVRRTLAHSDKDRPVGPFNFFLTEQKAIGKMIMHRKKGEFGHELDTISLYEFKESLKLPPLCDSFALNQSLETLRNARELQDIEGRERLAEVQNHLVDLLQYVETKEGYSLFPGKRAKCSRYKKLAHVTLPSSRNRHRINPSSKP